MLRNYLSVASIITFMTTMFVMRFFVEGNVSGAFGTTILLVGVGVSILFAVCSKKGRLKTAVLGLYSLLIIGFVVIALLFSIAHI